LLGIIRFLYLPYNPDLVLCGFWLFGTLKRRLEGYMFEDPVEVMTAVSTFLSKILLDVFISVFDEWKCRLRECIDRRGKYL
jgi:hypothetical protein